MTQGTPRPWTCAEEAALRDLAFLGAAQVAIVLGRSRQCVKRKASRLHVSVKRRTEISVTVLSPLVVERIKARDPGLICPMCGKRFVAIEKTGLCGACHKTVLIEGHNARLAEMEVNRTYNAVKQRVKRRRDELGIQAPNGHATRAKKE